MVLLRFSLLVGVATAFTSAPFAVRHQKNRNNNNGDNLFMFDATIAESVATAAAIPAVFVGTGSFLLSKEGEEEDEAPTTATSPTGDGEVDLYRDTLLRYAGYANEVGEAFAPLVPAWCVPASYGVAITYVCADTVDKTYKALNGQRYSESASLKCALIEGLDALIWQLAASVALPGYTIHQIVAITVTLLSAAGLDSSDSAIIGVLPTAIGLATIPFIVKPLDELAEVGMDVTLRKLWAPYLESCEI
eukprot:CAMPEP_0194048962 /NCGR_PEP_ID=MMETSP0009_2-20130614/29186_1 /TAXON_ID=210454 /ORGANISM="Grammatophora oceanica, Strain CCMP 410" /LENGTH=247 /DNA_ID=CAMNT_0038695001 /DNA_START=74 /DNA_END=817 /DNA_ORIENTATION=+